MQPYQTTMEDDISLHGQAKTVEIRPSYHLPAALVCQADKINLVYYGGSAILRRLFRTFRIELQASNSHFSKTIAVFYDNNET